jgi:hypothetical protein
MQSRGVSDVARVDYYRCPVCGEVWTAPKEGDESEPTEYDTTAELGFA